MDDEKEAAPHHTTVDPPPSNPHPSPTPAEIRAATQYEPKKKDVGWPADHDPPPSPDWGKSRAAREAAEAAPAKKPDPLVKTPEELEAEAKQKALESGGKGSYKNRAVKSE